MSNQPQNHADQDSDQNDDLHDRLIDGALREVVGAETPPDLSEQILFAATGEHSQLLSTLAPGEDGKMTFSNKAATQKRNRWIGATLAASLLVGSALILPKFLADQEMVEQDKQESFPMTSEEVTQATDTKPSDSASAEPESLVDLVLSTVESETYAESKDAGLSLDAYDQENSEALMMTVTPRLIIQDEEKESLGIPTSGFASNELNATRESIKNNSKKSDTKFITSNGPASAPSQASTPNFTPSNNIGLQGLSNDAISNGSSPLPSFSSNLNIPSRGNSRFDSSLSRTKGTDGLMSGVGKNADTDLDFDKVGKSGTNGKQQINSHETEEQLARQRELTREIKQKLDRYGVLSKNLSPKSERWGEVVSADQRYIRLKTLKDKIRSLEHIQRDLKRSLDANTTGDQYSTIYENPFIEAQGGQAVSTFSIDVDTASYANVRQFLMRSGQLPPPDAVRIEELVNYFNYDYSAPTDSTPFASNVEIAGCPWQAKHRLVRVGIKGREIETDRRPPSNLVFLIDVSGSMNESAKLPLLVSGLKMMTRQLGENDSVAIVVYASSEGLALPSTRGDKQATILAALEKLRAGGSTAGGAGIKLAYKLAKENFIEGGVNRVILATDGDFNVGTTNTADLERMAEAHAKETGVFLTVLGFGRGNLNDAMMEKISGKGNGNYHYIDNQTEARKVLVAEMAGTLVTIAKDVKLQIEFNPAQVAAYRLIGYENRMLKTEDFNDDKKDAGEIGAGHTVTAIYEVVPAGVEWEAPKVDALKYQQPAKIKEEVASDTVIDTDDSGELLTLKIRYKQPDGDKSTKLEFPITDNGQSFAEATQDFKFASAVASFGMQLRHSQHQGITSYGAVEEIAESNLGTDKQGYRAEFLQMIRQAKVLAGEK